MIGRYQLEAAVQSAHAVRRLTGRSDWAAIERLYDALSAITDSPVVAINRAVAIAETRGAEAGLARLDALADRQAAGGVPALLGGASRTAGAHRPDGCGRSGLSARDRSGDRSGGARVPAAQVAGIVSQFIGMLGSAGQDQAATGRIHRQRMTES